MNLKEFDKPKLVNIRLFILVSCLLLNGCGFVGVELLNPIEIEVKSIDIRDFKSTANFNSKIQIGASINEVVNQLGKPKVIVKKDSFVLYKYRNYREVKSGGVICLVLIPLPFRSENEGEYSLYFFKDKLIKIISLETIAGFYGVYFDGSGHGIATGEKSKCNV